MPDLVEDIGNRARLHFHRGQTRAWESPARFTFVFAGTQGGKTSFLPWWLKREIDQCGHGDYLAVTATYDLFKLKFLPSMLDVFQNRFGWSYAMSDRVLWYKYKPRMFDRIILRSAESEGGLESSTAKAAILDECGLNRFQVGQWEAIQRRLSLSQGRVLGGTTIYNLGWTKTHIYDKWKAGIEYINVVQFPSYINPMFPREEYERVKSLMADWKFSMQYDGQFERPAGLIYGIIGDDQFVDDFEIPVNWRLFIGIDPGPVHTAVIWMAEDPATGAMYLCREYLQGDRTTREHVKAVKEMMPNPITVAALGQLGEKQYRKDWKDQGLETVAPNVTSVESGIDRVYELIKTRKFFVFKSCTGTSEQFRTYSRVVDDSGNVTEEIKDKSAYHYMDAVRYGVIGIKQARRVASQH